MYVQYNKYLNHVTCKIHYIFTCVVNLNMTLKTILVLFYSMILQY